MNRLLSWSTALVMSASSLAAQPMNVAQRLGYPANSKLLILHGDDLGVAHSVNIASLDAIDRGAISSASIMMPTPWVTEVAAYAKAHPDADLGLHLTLTSEWETYRWGSVASKDQVPSLLDADGTFPSDVPPVAARAKPAEVERALAMGIHPTHLDSHMGALFVTNDLIATYIKIAREYHLPFLAMRGNPPGVTRVPLGPNDIVFDDVIVASPDVARDHWKEFYLETIAKLKPGLNEIIVHLGHDDSELQAVTVNHEPYGAAWRQRDYDVVNSAEFRKALKDNNVIVIRYQDLQKLVKSTP